MHKFFRITLSFILIFAFCACNSSSKKYRIGVSQCSEDSWRSKLKTELILSTYFHDDVELIVTSADDNVEQQFKQIDSLVGIGIDILIVSPQQTGSLNEALNKVADKGIPIVLFDRKSDVERYNAYMGADNYKIGSMLADYAAGLLGEKGCVVEIAGELGSSPATERHKGFCDGIAKYPGMKIVASGDGDWKEESGFNAMQNILSSYHGPIDCVFGGNDRMVLGARKAIESAPSNKNLKSADSIVFIGVDALPIQGGGMELVRDRKLAASAMYPTHGMDLMRLALNILNNEPYEKHTDLETSIVTADNANILLLQNKEINKQEQYIKKMHSKVDNILAELGTERVFLVFIIIVTFVIMALLAFYIRTNRQKHFLNEQLQKRNEELNREKETVESQRDELERQRDELIEASIKAAETAQDSASAPDEISEPSSTKTENEFMVKFLQLVDDKMEVSDLSVEDLGQIMGHSRTQLYRKVKALTGKSPVEIVRERRLMKASEYLADSSLSISEIAYRVGFSSPSYFTKCYKDMFGKVPTIGR